MLTRSGDAAPRGPRRPTGTESPWALVWGRFRHHRLALVSGVILALLYLSAIFAEFLAPGDPQAYNARYTLRRRNRSICSTATRTGAWSSAPTSTAMR
ncbi:MAG: hypothetical protein R3D25_13530 [Geminicoccaceae bacterium]